MYDKLEEISFGHITEIIIFGKIEIERVCKNVTVSTQKVCGIKTLENWLALILGRRNLGPFFQETRAEL